MSLIPSESYSFPDHFTTTRTVSRKPKNVEAVAPPRKKPAIVALPNLKPQPEAAPPVADEQIPDPSRKIVPPLPNPALRRASAPPPRIPEAPIKRTAIPPTLKPKVRWNTRAPAMDPGSPAGNGAEQVHNGTPTAPAQNVIPMKPVQAGRPPRAVPPPESRMPPNPIAAPSTKPLVRTPRPAPVYPGPETRPEIPPEGDFFEMFAQTDETALLKRRRQMKMRRFIACEGGAIAVFLLLAILGLAHRPDSAALLWIMNIFTIASAVTAALIPILFFAFTPTLPEIES